LTIKKGPKVWLRKNVWRPGQGELVRKRTTNQSGWRKKKKDP